MLHVDGTTISNGSNGPDLYVGYLKISFDIGDLTVLAGASGAFGESRINHGLDRAGKSGSGFTGDTYILGSDITLKYQFDSVRFISLQAEYLYRDMRGTRYQNNALDVMTQSEFSRRQSGMYAQVVAKLTKRWRCGARYDLLWMNHVEENEVEADLPEGLPRYSFMLEYNPTEFSRFRVQYNCDASKYRPEADAYEKKTNHEVIVQANLAIGAHGAHSF